MLSRAAQRMESDFGRWLARLPANLRGEDTKDLRAAFNEAYAMGEHRGESDAVRDLSPRIRDLERELQDRDR